MECLKQFETIPPQFDPLRDVRFRNKPLHELDKGELLEALCQTLQELRRLSR